MRLVPQPGRHRHQRCEVVALGEQQRLVSGCAVPRSNGREHVL